MIKSSNSGVKHVAHTEETLPSPDLPKHAEQEINDEELRRAIRYTFGSPLLFASIKIEPHCFPRTKVPFS